MAKILFVEDDSALAELVLAVLQKEKFTVEHVVNGSDGLELALCYDFSLIILDVELPGLNGMEICRGIRKTNNSTPILMLTGRSAIDDRTTGLDIGADDYLTKPFGSPELLARIRALLRRSAGVCSNLIEFGDLSLDMQQGRILLRDNLLDLNPREYDLLEFLLRHPQQIFSTDSLLNNIWKSDAEQSADALRMCIARVRKKIDDPSASNSRIRTVNRVGYMLDLV